jgi:hypothetical protein
MCKGHAEAVIFLKQLGCGKASCIAATDEFRQAHRFLVIGICTYALFKWTYPTVNLPAQRRSDYPWV